MTRSKTLHCVFERDKGMREVDVNEIIKNIKEMCIEANHFLSKDMKEVYDAAAVEEESPLGRQILGQLQENLQIAGEDMIPICQDTGMAVVFVKVGQEVHITWCRAATVPCAWHTENRCRRRRCQRQRSVP